MLVKSPLNYTGGKFKLLPQLLPLFPKDINLFVDGFTGGANVIANVKAKDKVAIDINPQLIELLNFLSKEPSDIPFLVDSIVREFNLSKTNKDGYLALRDSYNKEKRFTAEAPLYLFVLICYSFNNQIRFNKRGEFNLPFGKDRSSFNDSIRQNLLNFIPAIMDVDFKQGSYQQIEDELAVGDYLYSDPPYLITTATYNEQGGWDEEEEWKLLAFLDRLNARGIKFGLSNVLENKGKTNEILLEWSKKYIVHDLDKTYKNCNYQCKNKDMPTREVFITNYHVEN